MVAEMLSPLAALWVVLLLGASLADADFSNWTTPISFFYSRPDLRSPAMNVTLYNRTAGLVDDSYVFMTPYQNPHAGPFIYDKGGNLVWSGFGEVGPYNAHNLHVCDYQGSPHLCLFQGNQKLGYSRGHALILDSNYKIVKTVEAVGDTVSMDQHEFRLTPGGETALITIYKQEAYDLTRLGIDGNVGWITNCIFQELNVTDNSLIFEWRSLDHVEPWSTYVYPQSSDIAGTGVVPSEPWDYFHINSVFRSELSGDYLISARHVGRLYMIDHEDGHIIWTLESGGLSDFTCLDFDFSFQHDAEIQHENSTHMLISLYDNASNNANRTADASSGLFVAIDFEQKIAYKYRPSTYYPDFPLSSASQGNTQITKSGNAFHSHGSWAHFSEHTVEGVPIWSARLGTIDGVIMSYRGFSQDWKSVPQLTKPTMWSFSRTSDSPLALYVSWNGCTETRYWQFYGARDKDDVYVVIGLTERRGFETVLVSETHYAYIFAEAIGPNNESLRNSSITKTFIPSPELAINCNDLNCDGDPPPR